VTEIINTIVPAGIVGAVGLLWKIGNELTKLRIIISSLEEDIRDLRHNIRDIEDDIDKLED
jgi:predicted  nucleic acid-binding Zn-ribbon protein